jgi:hypothetical protein
MSTCKELAELSFPDGPLANTIRTYRRWCPWTHDLVVVEWPQPRTDDAVTIVDTFKGTCHRRQVDQLREEDCDLAHRVDGEASAARAPATPSQLTEGSPS